MLSLRRAASKSAIKRAAFLDKRRKKAQESINGMKLVFSGFRDPQLEKALQKHGGKISTSVTKDTDLVIVLDTNIVTTKTEKAKELEIPIVIRNKLFGFNSAFELPYHEFKNIPPPSKVNGETIYYQHDNGGRPFRTAIGKDGKVNVKKVSQSEYGGYDETILDINRTEKIWIGNEYYGKKEKYVIGNSILVKLLSGFYAYIGDNVYMFTTPNGEVIDEFHGDVGNSDVVYSYAYSQNYTYFFIDMKMIENRILDEYDPDNQKPDPYDVRYSHDDAKAAKEIEKKLKKLPNLKIIQKRIW